MRRINPVKKAIPNLRNATIRLSERSIDKKEKANAFLLEIGNRVDRFSAGFY
ncbi:MAG: hypothetical protein K9G70_06155 [Prolixibacteraceae bacterium]|nr:hypothetical protein [Prolixibacteraceae bacterium]